MRLIDGLSADIRNSIRRKVERVYDSANVLTAEVSLPADAYPDRDTRRGFYDDLVERHGMNGSIEGKL